MSYSSVFAATKILIPYDAGSAWPPFAYGIEGKPTGIVFGILQLAAQKFGYALEYLDLTSQHDPHARENYVLNHLNQAVCTGPASKSWYSEAKHKILWSSTIIDTVDELWLKKETNSLAYRSFGDLAGKRVGTCKGYTYPVLEPLFANGKLKRVDFERVSSIPCELFALRAVKDHKVDAAVANRHVFGYMLKNRQIERGDIESFVVPVEKVQLRFLCANNHISKEFLSKISITINKMRVDGSALQIIQSHSSL